jgi:hypothetical protein
MMLGYEPTEEYITETYGTGWRKKEQVLPPATPGGKIPSIGPEFAEVSHLTEKRVQHRRDQQSLIDAAEYLSTKYNEAYGKRVEQLLSYLDETDDIDTFRQRINDMMAEQAPEQAAEFIEQATWFSRLMGLFKGDMGAKK